MKDLNVALVQCSLSWEDAEANRKHIGKLLESISKSSVDLILLPEMFASGFTMNAASVAETMDGDSVRWMKQIARNKKAVVCGSLVIKEKKKFYNRLLWITPSGAITVYDKRHLFRMAGEEKVYTAGTKRVIVSLGGWRICPLVCYDLRFPVWCRNADEYDLLLFVANWPSRRRLAWKQLLTARAIENQCYVAGLNRVGKDGKGIPYTGDSIIHGPFGETLAKATPSRQQVIRVSLEYKALQDARKHFPVMLDRDAFKILNK